MQTQNPEEFALRLAAGSQPLQKLGEEQTKQFFGQS